MTLYSYVGPAHLRNQISPTRRHIRSAANVADWMARNSQNATEITATFIVNARGELWIADRRSEHVACAEGGPVLSAGEMTFRVVDDAGEIVGVTNQSTGFCPRPQSWPAVARALERIGLTHPGAFTAAFEFRRCDECGEINVVKDDWFVCALCEAELNREWNLEDFKN